MTKEEFAEELIRTFKRFAEFENQLGHEFPSRLKESTEASRAFSSAAMQVHLLLEKDSK